MKTIGQIVVGVAAFAAFIVLMLGLGWLAQGNDFFMYKFFAPKQEAVRREVFEESKAFNQGMIQELQNMQFEYMKAGEKEKDALASIILHRAADYDESKMPADLRDFIRDLKRERTLAK
ncbi:MAG: hypothetical protein Q7R63_01455 [bacterium]|nr:hypothetical protein [bacterium]